MKKFLRFLMFAVSLLPFTLLAQVSLPISIGFENETDLSQWTMTNCNENTGISPSYAHGGSHSFAFRWTTNPPQYLISPEFDAATGTEMISFWYANFSTYYNESFEVGFSSTTNNVTDFTWLPSVAVPETPWTEYTTYIPAGTKYVAIKSTANDAYYLYIDDIYIGEAPTCFNVTNLTIDAAQTTSNSLTLSWTDALNSNATYNIYNMSNNTLIASNITDTTYTINNLNSNTFYTFGISTDCGGGDLSAGFASVSGRTACGTVSMPWAENFDNWTSLNDCWTFLGGAYNGGNGTPTEAYETWSLGTMSTPHITISGKVLAANVYYINTYWAITPPVEITDDDAMLSVDVAVSGSFTATPNFDSDDTLAFAITTDNGASYTSLFVVNNTVLNTLNGEYTTFYIPVTGYNGQTVRFAIFAGSRVDGNDNANIIVIDNVVVGEPINCMPISNLTVSNIISTGATLTWEGNADGYTIWNMADTTVEQYTTDVTVDLYALDPYTQYTFGVSANCGSDESMIRTISFTTLVSCPAPTNLTAILTPGDGSVASLSWNNNGTEAWQLCLNGDTNNLIDVTDNPYELTNLTPEQTYTAMVRAYCDVDDQSAWSNTITFTPTDAYSITLNDGTTTNNNIPIYGFYTERITKSQFIIPAVNLAAMQFGTINKLTFYSSDENISWGAAQFEVYLTETTETTLSALADYSSMTQVYAGSLSISNNKMEITFANPYIYLGGNLMIGFLQTAVGSWTNCYWYGVSAIGASMGGYNTSISQQDFLPKTTIDFTPGDENICLPVAGLTVESATANSIFLSWSDNNNTGATYTIYDLSDTSVVASNISDYEYEVTGLTGSTSYTFGVVTNCSSSEESFMVTVHATTDCEGGSCLISIVGEDSYGDGWSGNTIAVIQNGVTIGTFTISNGSNNTETYSVCSETPVSFSWTTGNFAYETRFEIRDGNNTVVYTVTDGSTLSNGVFYTMNNSCPTCIAPIITVTDVSENSVSISWTGDADSYDVYIGNDFEANVTTNTYTFSGLTASTGYTIAVQAICSADDSSTVTTINVATSCDTTAINLPFTETFNLTSGTRDCWTNIDADNDGFAWTTLQDYSGADLEAMLSYSYYNGNYTALNPDNWLISPKLHSNAGSIVTMQWNVSSASNYPAEHYGVYVSTTDTDTSSFTMVDEWTITNGSAEMKVLDLSSYAAGQDFYVAFRHHSCTDQYVLKIDDVRIYEGAFVPDTLTVTFEVDDATMGTTVPAPGTYQYITGDTIYFGSQANPGYHFLKWEITMGTQAPQEFGSQYANGYYVLANAWMHYQNVVFKAFFEAGNPDSTTITYAVNDANMGTITPAPGTYTIFVGDNITATATPNTDYVLSAWIFNIYSGSNLLNSDTIYSDDAEFNNPKNFGTIPQSYADNDYTITIIAVFEPSSIPVTTHTVTLNTADATMGTVAPAGANTVNEGSSFTATATALDGYHFVAWMNGTTQVSTANPYTFTVTGDITLTATFEANDPAVTYYNVSVTSANTTMGNVTSSHSGQVAENTEVTVTAIPAANYRFVNWTNDAGTEVSTANPYTFTVTANITLFANFEIIDNIDDVTLSQSVNLMPNPADNYIELSINSNVEAKEAIVYNAFGQMIQTVQLTENHARIDLSNMAAGMYFVRVNGEGVSATKKFIKR